MKNTLPFLLVGTLIALMGRCDSVAMAAAALQTVAVATSAAGQTGYIAALIEAKGIAANHGLKIENLRMDFTEAANAVKLGRAVASAMQPSTAINLIKSGTNIRLITPQIWSGNAWVVRKESPYKTLADLKGKKIGNFARVTGAYFFSAVIAKEKSSTSKKISKLFRRKPVRSSRCWSVATWRRSTCSSPTPQSWFFQESIGCCSTSIATWRKFLAPRR